MALPKLTKREKQIFYACVGLISILGLQLTVLNPLGSKLNDLDKEIRLLENRLIKGMRQEKQRDQILRYYKDFQPYLKLSGSDEEVTAEFLREIEKLARESDFSLSDVKPRAVNKRQSYKEYTIDIRAEAATKDLIVFLYRINESMLLLKADKVTLSLKEEGLDMLKINILISGIVLL